MAPRARSSSRGRSVGTVRAYPRSPNQLLTGPDRLPFVTLPQRAPGGFPVVGIIGGSQLARMCQPPSVGLSITLSVFTESADTPAALVVPSSTSGDVTDLEAVRVFASQCDVVTFDHEDVPAEVLAALQADGVVMHPSPAALGFAQDTIAMRRRLTAIGVACDFERGTGLLGDGLLAEQRADVVRDLAVLVARSPSGQAAAWPVVEMVRSDSTCTQVLAPAPGLDPALAAVATEAALRIAGELGVTGVMAVEMFEVRDELTGVPAYVVNELAMRPHHSGHWTIDGAMTSQFEQHLRAVLDLPLGDTSPRARWTVTGTVLGGSYGELYPTYRHLMARDPGLKIHLYGKGVRPGRTIGHVTVSGNDLDDLRARANHACDFLQGVITE
jgi:5-(carboxyamino)imidazole ribonucleotide synthase